MSEHEELKESIAAWVLGALDAGEAEIIAAHVDGCSICRETANRLQRVAAAMPLEAEEMEPPASLRHRLLTAATTSSRPSSGREEARPARRTSRPRRFGVRRFDRVQAYAVAAGVLLALVIGVILGEVVGHVSPPPSHAQVARFTLEGHGSMAGARASVIDLKSDGIALVDFTGLPDLQPGHVYELWLITPDKRADPAGVFVPDSSGTKVVVVGKPLAGYVTLAVTAEQGPDGVQSPTQQPELLGSVV